MESPVYGMNSILCRRSLSLFTDAYTVLNLSMNFDGSTQKRIFYIYIYNIETPIYMQVLLSSLSLFFLICILRILGQLMWGTILSNMSRILYGFDEFHSFRSNYLQPHLGSFGNTPFCSSVFLHCKTRH